MKKSMFVLFALSALILSACGKSQAATPTLEPVPAEFAGKTNPLGPDAATQGAKIFEVNCAPCHGPQGHGDGPAGEALDPKPKKLSEFVPTVGDDYLFWRVNTGKPGTSMAPWAGILTEEQIWQVISFLHTLK